MRSAIFSVHNSVNLVKLRTLLEIDLVHNLQEMLFLVRSSSFSFHNRICLRSAIWKLMFVLVSKIGSDSQNNKLRSYKWRFKWMFVKNPVLRISYSLFNPQNHYWRIIDIKSILKIWCFSSFFNSTTWSSYLSTQS